MIFRCEADLVEIDKGTSISNDMIPLSNEEEVIRFSPAWTEFPAQVNRDICVIFRRIGGYFMYPLYCCLV